MEIYSRTLLFHIISSLLFFSTLKSTKIKQYRGDFSEKRWTIMQHLIAVLKNSNLSWYLTFFSECFRARFWASFKKYSPEANSLSTWKHKSLVIKWNTARNGWSRFSRPTKHWLYYWTNESLVKHITKFLVENLPCSPVVEEGKVCKSFSFSSSMVVSFCWCF